MSELVNIAVPGTDKQMVAAIVAGRPMTALKPLCDDLGIDDRSQRRKLDSKSWATGVIMTSVAADGKSRDMYMIDRRTLTMWLATIDENRVRPEVRPALIALQAEAADALEAHFARKPICSCNADLVVVWSHDEVCAQLRQRFGMDFTVNQLTRIYRDVGIWKQNGSPRAEYRDCFWHTGSAYYLHAHMLPRLAVIVGRKVQALTTSQTRQLNLFEGDAA